MFVNGSGPNVQSLERTFYRCFLPSFSSFGWGVSKEKIKMWKVNERQMTDDGRQTPSDGNPPPILPQFFYGIFWKKDKNGLKNGTIKMLLQYASIQSFELFTFQTVGRLLCIQTFVIDGLTIGQDRTNSMPPSHLKDGGRHNNICW